MNLLNKLLTGAVAAISVLAAHADDYTAKSVTVNNSKGSANMTLLGTASDGYQIWACQNTLGGGTNTQWTIDGTAVSAGKSMFYSNVKTTLTATYDSNTTRSLPTSTDLYQYVKTKSQSSAELIFGNSTDTEAAYDDFAVQASIKITEVGNYTLNSGVGTLTQPVKWEATGIAGSAVEGVTIQWSYDGGQSWEGYLFSDAHSTSSTEWAILPTNVEHVRYRAFLHPYKKYRTVMAQDYWESDQTTDYDVSPTNRVVYSPTSIYMRTDDQSGGTSVFTYYDLLGVTGNGYQIWSAKLADAAKRYKTLWCIQATSHTAYWVTKSKDKFDANEIWNLNEVNNYSGNREIVSGSDYTHFVKANSSMAIDYFCWKYEEGSTSDFNPTEFKIATMCSLEPTGDYAVNDYGNLLHNLKYTIKNANSLMFDKAVVEFSCDGGTTWTAGTTVEFLSSNKNETTTTATITVNNIPLEASTVRYRLTVYPKNDYKIVCDDLTFESADYSVVRPTDEYPNVWVYKRVTSEDELIAGDAYLIVNAAGKAMGAQNDKTRKAEDVTLAANTLKLAESRICSTNSTDSGDAVTEFTLGGETGSWTFRDKFIDGSYYLCASGTASEAYCLETTQEDTEAMKASIAISETGDATITFGGDAAANTIGYNNAEQLFTCYPTVNTPDNVLPVQLYRRISAFTITDAGYGTYYSNFAYAMPSGATGYTVTLNDDNTIALNPLYTTGRQVPAFTPLLIKARKGQYNLTAINSTDAAPAENLLRGTLANKTTTADGDCLYYKLSKNPADGKVGFYWGAAEGAAFTNTAYKAYLALPKSEAASQQRGFAFNFDDTTTSISTTAQQAAATASPSSIHDLNGRRLSTLRGAQKGLYIVDGKKVLVK